MYETYKGFVYDFSLFLRAGIIIHKFQIEGGRTWQAGVQYIIAFLQFATLDRNFMKASVKTGI
jgi:hypothetical protein